MYIVTGGAGFIGSNLVHELNHQGITDILVVDNLADPRKTLNLHGARFVDYMDKHEFRRALSAGSLGLPRVEAIFHQGACSNTLVDDGRVHDGQQLHLFKAGTGPTLLRKTRPWFTPRRQRFMG